MINCRLILITLLFPAILAGKGVIKISNFSSDTVFVRIKFSSKNIDTILFDNMILKNENKLINILNTDSFICGLDIDFFLKRNTYQKVIFKKAYTHNSDLKITYFGYHTDSIKLENSIYDVHPKSLEILDAICRTNEVSFILQKDLFLHGRSVPDPFFTMDLLTKFYLNSDIIDLYKLKRLYDYCSFGGNEYISKQDLEKQMNRFDTSKWTYLYEYKQLKAYIEHLNNAKNYNTIDYSFLNLKQQEEKLTLNSKKITVFVFWSTPCGKIKCFPYFEKLSIWKNKLKSLDFITISSENTNEGWKDGIARCNLKLWKNYRSTKESMDPMAIDYKISNVYQSFLILGKDNEVLFKTTDYEKLDNYFKSNF